MGFNEPQKRFSASTPVRDCFLFVIQNNWTQLYVFLKTYIFTSSYFSSLHVAFDVWKPVLLALLHWEFWIGFGSDAGGSAIANYQPNCHLPNQPPPPSPISARQQLLGKSAPQTTFKSAPASAVKLQPLNQGRSKQESQRGMWAPYDKRFVMGNC